MDTIINKVAESKLEIFDLEDLYPTGKRISLDISQWLTEGFLLKEKEFRKSLSDHDWKVYKDAYVAIYCSTDAIIPAWANILVTVHLTPYAKLIINGSIEDIDAVLYQNILNQVDYSAYVGKSVILKGCSRKPVPMSAYLLAAQNLQRVAKSIMYGEACSAVPLYKKR